MYSVLQAKKMNSNLVDDHMHKLIFFPGPLAWSLTHLTWWSARSLFAVWSALNAAAHRQTHIRTYSMYCWAFISECLGSKPVSHIALYAHNHTHTHLQTVTGRFQNVMVSMCEWGNYTMSFTTTMLYGWFDSLCKPFPVDAGGDPSYIYSYTRSIRPKDRNSFPCCAAIGKIWKKSKSSCNISANFSCGGPLCFLLLLRS